MRRWVKVLFALLALLLASSYLYSADLHWLFFDKPGIQNQIMQSQAAQPTLAKESLTLQTECLEMEQIQPEEPLKSLEEESLENEPTGFEGVSEDAVIKACEDALEQMEYAYDAKDESFVIVSAQYEAQGVDYLKLYESYSKLKDDYAKAKDPFKLYIKPEALFTFGDDPWGAGLTIGAICNNVMFSVGVDKKNITMDSIKSPDGYTLRMGVGLVF